MNYPFELRRQEVDAIHRRRKTARVQARPSKTPSPKSPAPSEDLPEDTIGLALSGGGIRSATVSLGVLQALAKLNRLRDVDILSTVSGGGYAGSFVGRLFTRALVRDNADPCARVQSILADNQSPQIKWLRKYANYIIHSDSDLVEGLGVFWRNLFAINLVLIFLGGSLFALFRMGGDRLAGMTERLGLPGGHASISNIDISPWWPLPVAVFALAVAPCALAFWLAPGSRSRAAFDFTTITTWILLLTSLGICLSLTDAPGVCGVAIAILLLSAIWLELARRQFKPRPDPLINDSENSPGAVMRNWLTRALGENLGLFFLSVAWVLLDSLARTWVDGKLVKVMAGWGLIMAPCLPFLRQFAEAISNPPPGQAPDGNSSAGQSTGLVSASFKAGLVAFPLAAFLLVLLDGLIHLAFNHRPVFGVAIFFIGGAVSLMLGHAFHFVNISSLHQTYAARLCRAFLGASNPARIRSTAEEAGYDVSVVHPHDDMPFEDYHPEKSGGPLHLMSVCVSETTDAASQREIPDSKGLPMCVGPCGVSVGRNYHALWCAPPNRPPLKIKIHRLMEQSADEPASRSALRAITRAGELFHVLKGKTAAPVMVERLSLSAWVSISGAALGASRGRSTKVSLALLMGLSNLRLGYWWDSRLSRSERPGCFPRSPWQWIKDWPALFVPMQTLLLSEFRGQFGGPSLRRWNLSDGGFFENTAMYELLRRRVPIIIAVDAGADPQFSFQDLGELVRKARIDFGATIEFFDDPKAQLASIPPWFAAWIQDNALGNLSNISQKGTCHAALGRATYADDNSTSWILYLKSSLSGKEAVDVTAYQRSHPAFPNEPTTSQFFNESQWESYRMLGEEMAASVFKS